MERIKRNRGVSHKKKKVTAAFIKVENSRKKRASKLDNALINNLPISRKKPKTRSTVTSSAPAIPLPTPNDSSQTSDVVTAIGASNNDAVTEHDGTSDSITSAYNNSPVATDAIGAGNNDAVTEHDGSSDSITDVVNPTPVVIDSPFNFPKNKAKAFITISKDKINMSFRVGQDNITNLVPQISKEILSNFSYKYKRRATNTRRTGRTIPHNDRLLSIDNTIRPRVGDDTLDGVTFSNYTRCYVEDFMTRNIGELILVLLPTRYADDTFSRWYDLMSTDIKFIDICFTKQKYRGYIATITTNPILARVQSGMHRLDYSAGFGNQNYGCNVTFEGSCSTSKVITLTYLITWKEVLEGKIDGIMVWREGNLFRNVFVNFADRQKTNQGVLAVLNKLFPEVYGDRIQCMHLIHCYHRTTIQMQQKYIKACDLVIDTYSPIDLNGMVYDELLNKCDGYFQDAIKLAYTDYVVIGSPIVTRPVIDMLVEHYVKSMKSHFESFYELLGFKSKSKLTKNTHLNQSGLYKRQVFYNMLSMARQKNPKKMKHWAMISAGANYGRGIGEIVNRRATYLGASTTTQTFLRAVKPYGNAMIENITSTLSHVNKTVWMLDNNQRGHPLKFQRYGSSNNFVKVTGRTSKQCIECMEDIGEEDTKHCVLSYVEQAIVNPINFPIFEKELMDIHCLDALHRCLTRSHTVYQSTTKIDITGNRVSLYLILTDIASTIRHTITPLLTGYNKTKNTYKTWKNQSALYCSDRRRSIAKHLHSEVTNASSYKAFQQTVVEEWNPQSKLASALIIPPVSLRDEIKTDGYGMAIIEILCLAGVLVKVELYTDVHAWELSRDWEKKSVYLCMDGLSLDRHRSFQKKLVSLPFSYKKTFEQSLIFQKALNRVVEISGPLHIAFHMLQSIFVIYKDMMKWTQRVIEWKKINVNKVSDSFDTCRRLAMMLLEELERLSVDLFIHKTAEKSFSDEYKSIDLGREYISFIHDHCSSDHRRKYMFGYIIMATEFRKYWTAVRCGDRVVMEDIQNKWIGVHLLSGKHKCVENYLTSMETEVKKVTNKTLQEIRMNISCRYHAGCDSRGHPYPQHPLDEVQENVNLWTKKILLGPDAISWKLHSPNVACAHMCVNFEESEFIKGHLDYSDKKVGERTTIHRSSKGVEPNKLLEKERLYEWCILMFESEIDHRECLVVDGYNTIKELKCTLKRATQEEKLDELETCITSMFGGIDMDCDLNISNNSDDVIQVINDDYTYNLRDASEASGTNLNSVSSSSTVSKLGCGNIFVLGKEKMIESKIPAVRERKQDRMLRSRAFFLKVNDIVTSAEVSADIELNSNDNTMIPNPWFRKCYRSMSN